MCGGWHVCYGSGLSIIINYRILLHSALKCSLNHLFVCLFEMKVYVQV